MSAFNRVIGYESIKKELIQVCDMFHHPDAYKDMGAKIPRGALLYGDPGLGKTLIAKCFVEEAGIKTYTLRRTKSEAFVEEISKVFCEAKNNAPSIVFLDDLDKFANEDDYHKDAEEYVAVQAGIDEVADMDVFVLATVNDMGKLPQSLRRAGRFDIRICVQPPNGEDSKKIIEYFLSDKKVSDTICWEDLHKMINYNSCAELEMIINQAAIYAVSEGKESIEMEHLCSSILRTVYDAPDDLTIKSRDKLEMIAVHEAGHVVVAECLNPESVGFVSLKANGRNSQGGFVHMCKDQRNDIEVALVALGGRAAAEMLFAGEGLDGSENDLNRAVNRINRSIYKTGTHGFGSVDVESGFTPRPSKGKAAYLEAVVQAELERCMFRVRGILIRNQIFLKKVREALLEKETLLHSDIQRIKKDLPYDFPKEAA